MRAAMACSASAATDCFSTRTLECTGHGQNSNGKKQSPIAIAKLGHGQVHDLARAALVGSYTRRVRQPVAAVVRASAGGVAGGRGGVAGGQGGVAGGRVDGERRHVGEGEGWRAAGGAEGGATVVGRRGAVVALPVVGAVVGGLLGALAGLPGLAWAEEEGESVGVVEVAAGDGVGEGSGGRAEVSLPPTPQAPSPALGPSPGLLVDPLNAYSFLYPTSIPGGKPLSWVESRRPERYSSAAPLLPDGRLRIVSERLEVKTGSVISVFLGPPNELYLPAGSSPAEWKAGAVARSVLTDKSTTRLTTGQKASDQQVDAVETVELDGAKYWRFEYTQQKSPTTAGYKRESYRRAVAVTGEREGYLYTLSISTPDVTWEKAEPVLREAIASFRLLPVTDEYVPPYKDPWRFW